jgi:uncharacterized protein
MTTPVSPAYIQTYQFKALQPGPRLIVLGAVHGNERCGTEAIRQVLEELEAGAFAVERGALTMVPVTNPLAYQQRTRQGDRNLNRNLRVTAPPADFEDRIANVLCPMLDAHDVLLDLHSFHTPGQPFVMVGPRNNTGSLEPFQHSEEEERLVAHLGPRRIVEGWMRVYERGVKRRQQAQVAAAVGLLDVGYGIGTSEYIRSRGGYGVTLECGQHDDPEALGVAYRAIRQTLALLGLTPLPLKPPSRDFQVLRLVDVVDRAHPNDTFAQPWKSFDPVVAGQAIGIRHDGRIETAPADGFIVFPNPGALPGSEWFYFAQQSERIIG